MRFEAVRPGLYKAAGDGHVLLTAFQREAPGFPGLLFEEPMPPSPDPKRTEVQTFIPTQRLNRLSGTVYYVVLLDSASSVFDKARTAYEDMLKGFHAE